MTAFYSLFNTAVPNLGYTYPLGVRDGPLGDMPKINSNGERYVFVSHNTPPVTCRLLYSYAIYYIAGELYIVMAIILLATIFKTHVGTTKIALYFDIVENGTRQEVKYNAVLIIFILYFLR